MKLKDKHKTCEITLKYAEAETLFAILYAINSESYSAEKLLIKLEELLDEYINT